MVPLKLLLIEDDASRPRCSVPLSRRALQVTPCTDAAAGAGALAKHPA